eukprot:928595-Rhodomonas_salina.1
MCPSLRITNISSFASLRVHPDSYFDTVPMLSQNSYRSCLCPASTAYPGTRVGIPTYQPYKLPHPCTRVPGYLVLIPGASA